MCKVPEARLCLACLRNTKEASGAGQGKVSEGRAVEDEIREARLAGQRREVDDVGPCKS